MGRSDYAIRTAQERYYGGNSPPGATGPSTDAIEEHGRFLGGEACIAAGFALC